MGEFVTVWERSGARYRIGPLGLRAFEVGLPAWETMQDEWEHRSGCGFEAIVQRATDAIRASKNGGDR